MQLKKTLAHIGIAIALCLVMALLSAFAVQSATDSWGLKLDRSGSGLPDGLFIALWTVLYVLMGIAAGIVWAKGFYHLWVKTALYHFGFLLLYSAMWNMLFFGLRKPFWSFLVALALLALCGFTIKWFKVVSRTAAWLLVPLLPWFCYIALLAYRVWHLE